jgi:hypothetical protein
VNNLVLTEDVLKERKYHTLRSYENLLDIYSKPVFTKYRKYNRSYSIEMQIVYYLANNFHGAESFLIN